MIDYSMMSPEQALHLHTWMGRTVAPSERDEVLGAMLVLLQEDPALLETHSWGEIRSLTETPQEIKQWVDKPYRV